MKKIMEYVAGFAFTTDGHVALIRKNKPDFQRGKWNGIGGKIEDGETPHQAMVREFREETGVVIEDWSEFCILEGEDWYVRFFTATSGQVFDVRTTTDEYVDVISLASLPDNMMANLRWLIPMALDKSVAHASVKSW